MCPVQDADFRFRKTSRPDGPERRSRAGRVRSHRRDAAAAFGSIVHRQEEAPVLCSAGVSPAVGWASRPPTHTHRQFPKPAFLDSPPHTSQPARIHSRS
jgi:hypothetical protein